MDSLEQRNELGRHLEAYRIRDADPGHLGIAAPWIRLTKARATPAATTATPIVVADRHAPNQAQPELQIIDQLGLSRRHTNRVADSYLSANPRRVLQRAPRLDWKRGRQR